MAAELNTGCIRNAAGYNDRHHIQSIGVHVAGELPSLLTADRRIKIKIKKPYLTSLLV